MKRQTIEAECQYYVVCTACAQIP